MKKKVSLLTAGIICVLSIGAGALATGVIEEIKAQLRPDFVVEIDGEIKNFKNADGEDVYPVLYKGTTYLPVRAIGEIMGKTVYWYENEKRIELREEKTTVTDADVIITDDKAKNKDNKKTDKVKDEKRQNKDKEQIDTSGFIGEEKAKDIALEKAGISASDVIFKKTKLEKDDGIYQYEIEFRSGLTKYEADISATDGKILSWDTDLFD